MPFIRLTRAEYDVLQPVVWVDTDQILQMEVVGGLTARTLITFNIPTGSRWPPEIEVRESPSEILALTRPGDASDARSQRKPVHKAEVRLLREFRLRG